MQHLHSNGGWENLAGRHCYRQIKIEIALGTVLPLFGQIVKTEGDQPLKEKGDIPIAK